MKIWICVVFFVFSIFWVIFIDIVVYCVVIYGIWMIYIGRGIFIYVWKKICFDNYKCFLYIFVYWENDVKENSYYNMDYLNMNGCFLYIFDYKNICSFWLYLYM